MDGSTSSARGVPVLISALLILGGPWLGTAGAQDTGWSPDVRPALQLYIDGDHTEARRLCAALLRGDGSAEVRRDAFVVQLLCNLHSQSREEVTGSRAYLLDLGGGSPSVLERPEVLLALGRAHISLHETSSALAILGEAADGFAANDSPKRQAAALAALADAWAIHNEWETTPDLKGARPDTPEKAAAMRIAAVRDLRKRAADLVDAGIARAHIDRVLAQLLLQVPAHEADGNALLEQLVAGTINTPDVAEAAMLLARRYERGGRAADALALYRRVADSGVPELNTQAGQQVDSLTHLQLELDTPASVPPEQPWWPTIRTRNARSLQIEIRAMDLDAWLTAQRGNFQDIHLPLSGRLVESWTTDFPDASSMRWWSSTDADTPAATLSAGAYVVSARAIGPDDTTVAARRLVVASELWAAVITGTRQALVWYGAGSSPATSATARVRFWMRGSYVPTETTIADGLGRFELPGEARVLLDKNWLCLIESDGQLAVCRGAVPRRTRAADLPTQVTLVAPAAMPQPGESHRLLGRLLSIDPDFDAWQHGIARLVVHDAMNKIVHEQQLSTGAAGLFAADIPITREMAGKVYRVTVDYNGAVLANVRSRFTFRTANPNDTPLELTCDVPKLLAPGTRELKGTLSPRYPWGSPPVEPRIGGIMRALRLPNSEENSPAAAAVPTHFHGHWHGGDTAAFEAPLTDMNLPPGPVALGIWAEAVGDDGRQSWANAQSIMGDEPIHTWLLHEPNVPHAGSPVRFKLGWFDPEGLAYAKNAALTVTGPRNTTLTLFPRIDGLGTSPWIPPTAGTYDLSTEIRTPDGQVIPINKRLVVAESDASSEGHVIITQARVVSEPGGNAIRVRLDGNYFQPILVMAHTDEPHAGVSLPHVAGQTDILVPLDSAPTPSTTVSVVGANSTGMRYLDQARVAPSHETGPAVNLSTAATSAFTDTKLDITVSCDLPAGHERGGTVLLRLVSAAGAAQIQWIPGESAAPESDTATALHVAGTLDALHSVTPAEAAPLETIAALPSLSPEDFATLFAGQTLWDRIIEYSGEPVTVSVPLPPDSGHHHVLAWLCTPDGLTARSTAEIDVRDSTTVTLDVPQRLSVGDRSVAAITLRNRLPEQQLVKISISDDDAVRVESMIQSGAAGADTNQRSCELTLAPHADAALLVRLEAARAGTGQLRVTVKDARVTREYAGSCHVLDDEAPGKSPIRIRRSIHGVLTGFLEDVDEPITQDRSRVGQVWSQYDLPAETTTTTGQYLLVRDEIEVPEAIDQFTWIQRAPANTHTVSFEAGDLLTLGRLTDRRLGDETYLIDRLDPGKYVREFMIIAARPGVCVLPAPVLRRGDLHLSVVVEPADARLIVAEPR